MNVISSEPALTIEQRSELVALAVWPSDTIVPGEVAPRCQRSSREERATAVAFAEQGFSEREIAERLNRPRTTIRVWIRAARL